MATIGSLRWRSMAAYVSISLALAGVSGPALSGELPPEARSLVDAFEKEEAEARNRLSGELDQWRRSLVTDLKAIQKQLATQDLLDEAIVVRSVVRTIEAETGSPTTKPFSTDEFNKLPKEAQKVLLSREAPGSVESRLEMEMAKKREQLKAKLSEMQRILASQDKLDEAVAVRDWLRVHVATGKTNPGITRPRPVRKMPDILSGAKNLSEIRANQQLATVELMQSAQADLMAATSQLIQGLQVLKVKYTKSGQLDEALAVRKTIELIDGEKAGNAKVMTVRTQRGKLPEEAGKLVDAYLEEVAKSDSESKKAFESIEAQLVKPLEDATRTAILGDNLEEARSLITELYRLKRKEFPNRRSGVSGQPLKLASPSAEIVDELASELDAIRAKVEERETPLRQELLGKLDQLEAENLKAEVELAVRRTRASLSDQNFRGLRGFLFFFFDPGLSGEAAEFVKKYYGEMSKLIEEARAEYAAKVDAARPRLDAARKAHTEAGEWGAAFSVMEWTLRPKRFFEPVKIKYGQGDAFGSHFPWDGMVIDVRDGALLVINVHQREEWMTRDRVRVGAEDFPETRFSVFNESSPAPGFPVTEKTKLIPGNIALLREHNRWLLVEVKEVRSEGIFIHYFGYSDAWDKTVQRAELRTMIAP